MCFFALLLKSEVSILEETAEGVRKRFLDEKGAKEEGSDVGST